MAVMDKRYKVSQPMVMRRAHYLWMGLAASLAAVAPALGSGSLRVVMIETPARRASLTPHLASSGDGLYLSWLERAGDGHELRVSRWNGTAFDNAQSIHASDHFFANWADFASVLPLGDGRLVAHWLEKAAQRTYDYDVWMAISGDDGRSWSEPARPHRDGTLSEHGFVSMVPQGESGFAAVWLDGREFEGAGDHEMTLRFTTYDDGFGEEVLLDGRVCECCQTSMTRTDDGLFVVYRDRSGEEIRDISYVRYFDGAWTEPANLNEDGWHLPGCPVNGPQVAREGRRVAVAWFTASEDTPRAYVTFSDDSGASFGEPVRVDDGNAVGRVDIAWLGDDVFVSWVEKLKGRDGEVRMKRVSSSGEVGPSLVVAKTGSGRASGFPRIARFDGDIFISWTESYQRNGPSQVRIARITGEVALLDEPARSFAAVSIDGDDYRLQDLLGKVVLLNFWGIWCTRCRDEIPRLVELDRKWRGSGLVVLGADYGDDPKDLPAFIEEIGMSYPALIDDGLADEYEVLVYPTSVVIDRNGRVRYRVEGFTDESFRALASVVEQLLAER